MYPYPKAPNRASVRGEIASILLLVAAISALVTGALVVSQTKKIQQAQVVNQQSDKTNVAADAQTCAQQGGTCNSCSTVGRTQGPDPFCGCTNDQGQDYANSGCKLPDNGGGGSTNCTIDYGAKTATGCAGKTLRTCTGPATSVGGRSDPNGNNGPNQSCTQSIISSSGTISINPQPSTCQCQQKDVQDIGGVASCNESCPQASSPTPTKVPTVASCMDLKVGVGGPGSSAYYGGSVSSSISAGYNDPITFRLRIANTQNTALSNRFYAYDPVTQGNAVDKSADQLINPDPGGGAVYIYSTTVSSLLSSMNLPSTFPKISVNGHENGAFNYDSKCQVFITILQPSQTPSPTITSSPVPTKTPLPRYSCNPSTKQCVIDANGPYTGLNQCSTACAPSTPTQTHTPTIKTCPPGSVLLAGVCTVPTSTPTDVPGVTKTSTPTASKTSTPTNTPTTPPGITKTNTPVPSKTNTPTPAKTTIVISSTPTRTPTPPPQATPSKPPVCPDCVNEITKIHLRISDHEGGYVPSTDTFRVRHISDIAPTVAEMLNVRALWFGISLNTPILAQLPSADGKVPALKLGDTFTVDLKVPGTNRYSRGIAITVQGASHPEESFKAVLPIDCAMGPNAKFTFYNTYVQFQIVGYEYNNGSGVCGGGGPTRTPTPTPTPYTAPSVSASAQCVAGIVKPGTISLSVPQLLDNRTCELWVNGSLAETVTVSAPGSMSVPYTFASGQTYSLQLRNCTRAGVSSLVTTYTQPVCQTLTPTITPTAVPGCPQPTGTISDIQAGSLTEVVTIPNYPGPNCLNTNTPPVWKIPSGYHPACRFDAAKGQIYLGTPLGAPQDGWYKCGIAAMCSGISTACRAINVIYTAPTSTPTPTPTPPEKLIVTKKLMSTLRNTDGTYDASFLVTVKNTSTTRAITGLDVFDTIASPAASLSIALIPQSLSGIRSNIATDFDGTTKTKLNLDPVTLYPAAAGSYDRSYASYMYALRLSSSSVGILQKACNTVSAVGTLGESQTPNISASSETCATFTRPTSTPTPIFTSTPTLTPSSIPTLTPTGSSPPSLTPTPSVTIPQSSSTPSPTPSIINYQLSITPAPLDLALTKSADRAKVRVGEHVLFTITVRNETDQGALQVKVKDILTGSFQYLGHETSYGTYDWQSGIWTIGNLPAFQSQTLKINARVANTTTLTNKAEISSMEGRDRDSTPDNGIESEDDFAKVVLEPQGEVIGIITKGGTLADTGLPVALPILVGFGLLGSIVFLARTHSQRMIALKIVSPHESMGSTLLRSLAIKQSFAMLGIVTSLAATGIMLTQVARYSDRINTTIDDLIPVAAADKTYAVEVSCDIMAEKGTKSSRITIPVGTSLKFSVTNTSPERPVSFAIPGLDIAEVIEGERILPTTDSSAVYLFDHPGTYPAVNPIYCQTPSGRTNLTSALEVVVEESSGLDTMSAQ